MGVLTPPGPGHRSSANNRVVQIVTADLSDMRYTEHYAGEDARVQVTLHGGSAERVLQTYGLGRLAPAPEPQIDHQDEALAAARRDAAEAKRRAVAAESMVASLNEELRDCTGEIEALTEDLEAEKKRSKWARGGIISVDPGNPSGPPLYAVTAPPGTSIHSTPYPAYSAADARITKALFDKLNGMGRSSPEKKIVKY